MKKVVNRSSDFLHVVVLPRMNQQHLATQWCVEQFGARWSAVDNRSGTWCCFWLGTRDPGKYEWLFKNSDDAVSFVLRWS